jgi:hypothetical protein
MALAMSYDLAIYDYLELEIFGFESLWKLLNTVN